MSKISMYAKRSLTEQAQRVPLDLLMIDPDFLESNAQFSQHLQAFLDIRDFAKTVRSSFDSLKTFARQWNDDPSHEHRITLRAYGTIPTMSMVLIDPETPTSEAVIEFFLYQSGENRPRLHIRNTDNSNTLFSRIYTEYRRLWTSAPEAT